MAVWSRVSTADLVGASRLDAEFWQPAFLEKELTIRKGEHAGLGFLVSTFRKGIFYILAREYAPSGIPFYRSSNVGAILPKDDGIALITAAKQLAESKTALEAGDLMIVKTGRSGASVVLVPECNVSQDVIAVKVRQDRINPYFLAVYLNTRYGLSEMNRWFQGQVQPHLSLEDARRIWVALIPADEQRLTELLVKQSAHLRTEAEHLHVQARRLLDTTLGLDALPDSRPLSYKVRVSDVEIAQRFDPEHFVPAFEHFRSNLPEGITLTPLSNQLEYCNRGQQPIYADKGLKVINSKHVQPNRVVLQGNRHGLPNADPMLQIRFGDTLINGTGRGTIGRAAPYLEEEESAVADNHVTMLRTKGLDCAYLSLYLNSRAEQMQVEMHQRGTSGQLELYPHDIRKFLVWHAPKEFQLEIRRLHDRALALAQKAADLLEEAKARAEMLIEQSNAFQ